MKKRILSLLLSIVMIIALLPATMTVYAADDVLTTTVTKSVGEFKYEIDEKNKRITLVSFSETWENTIPEITASDINFNGYINSVNYSDWEFVIGNRGLYIYPGMSGYPSAIKKITIPEKVTVIEDYAFSGSSKITTVVLPSTVKKIGSYAFSSCTSLYDVTIPDNIDTIESYIFEKCDSLRSFTLPLGVKNVNTLFFNCKNLTTIYFKGDLASYLESPYSYLVNGSSSKMFSKYSLYINDELLETVIIPDNVDEVPQGKFYYCSSIKKVIIPSKVKTIGGGAFSNCINLADVVLNEGIEELNNACFAGCTSLKSITIPNSVIAISNAFRDSTSLSEVKCASTLNENIVISGNAFYGTAWMNNTENYEGGLLYLDGHLIKADESIVTCTIKANTKTIAGYAFQNCTQLIEISIPDGIKRIEDDTFDGCSALQKVELPDGLLSIGYAAFYDCTSLQNIELPNSVSNIGTYAFRGCTKLKEINIPPNVVSITSFYGCSSLKKIILPEGLHTIGTYAFERSGIEEVNIPSTVTNIGYNAFPSYNSKVAKVYIDDMSAWLKITFENGSSDPSSNKGNPLSGTAALVLDGKTVEDALIPTSIYEIKNYAFYGYDYLKSVIFHNNVSQIGDYAFYYCNNLTDVYFNGTEQEWENVTVGSGNTKITDAQMHYFSYVDIYDNDNNVVFSEMIENNSLIDLSNIFEKTGYSVNLYTDKERTSEFDYLNTPINQNCDLYLGYSANQYTHKFLNDDGTVIEESSVDYGTIITPPANPTKPADDQYTYTFAGWEGFEEGITQKAEEMVFTAKYDKTVNQYSYHFVDEDGTVLKEDTVDYGTEIIPPENPTKQGSAQYSYTFTGWDGFTEGMTQTAEDMYFYATYSASINKYTYKFVDWDGTVLKEKTVNYNTLITPPSSPSKAPDAQYTYTFAGWDGYTVGMKATEDVTFTATYSTTLNQYTYKFVDALGNTILEKTVDYGTVIELPQEEITKAPDDEFTYTFTGWDDYTEDMTVTGNITFDPLFSKTTNKYSYQFVDEDGTVLKEDTVDYGTVITPPANPSIEADAQYTYTFKGWKGFTEGIKQTAETMVFTAEYNATVNQYTYKFIDEDGSVIKTQTVDYGTVITPPGNPSKASTDQYSYKFIGWNGYTDGMAVTKDETFKATYEEITNQYTYKFVDYAGNIVKEVTVDYGTVIVTPATPDGYSDQQYTYIFASWTGYVRGMKVTKDITFNARYTKVINQYTYVFMDENGNVLSEDTVDYGTKITSPEAPEKASTVQYSYEFAGWENYTDGVIVDDVIFIATYKPITNKYTYRFENEDGTEIKTVTADYGSIIEVPRNPQKEAIAQYSYEFAGWNGYTNGMTLTGDITFKATYTSIINQYTYKFIDEDGEALKELTVDYGTKIVVPDTTPQKDADVQYTYTFKEWNGYTDGMTITGDVTFVAVYDSILNQYTYKFVNEDGSLVKEQKADYGSVIILPDVPSKNATQQYSYNFIGWDGYTDSMTVAGDVVFTAKYTPVINQYTYVFKNDDGTEIKSVTADYGTDIVVPENPTKASTVQYSYTFASWRNYINGMSLTEDIIFVATYTSTLNQYTYKFVDNDGTELKSATVDYGTKIVVPATPSDKGAYIFDYWEGFTDGMNVTGDVTFKAVYKYKTYNISVDGYEINANATYGENYTITPAEKYGYDFVGYYTEADGNGTKLTDSEGNSLNAYEYEKDITVYPYFADLLVNKAVISGVTTMQVGDKDIKYTLILGTDRENISYATVYVKYPNDLSISKLEKKADIAEVIKEKDTVAGEYTTTEIIVIYSDDKAMPTKTPIEVFDIYFDVSKTADTKDFTISLTNNSVLMDSTSDYRFAELVGADATIKPKFPESINIEGEAVIDTATKYTAIVTPDYATYDVEWSVNDTSIASITADGIVTPIKNGTVIITAKALNNPEVFATKEITVKAYAKVASITTDGFWTEEFANDIKEYTVYVDEDATEFSITPVSASGGRFKINGSTVFSNRTETISLTSEETEVIITLTGATGYTDNTYILTVVKFEGTKTTVSEDGKSFAVTPINIGTGKIVILALYNGEQFVEMQSAIYTGEEIPFTTTKTYTKAKVMVWDNLTNLKPACVVEIVK